MYHLGYHGHENLNANQQRQNTAMAILCHFHTLKSTQLPLKLSLGILTLSRVRTIAAKRHK
jgi:hypothetical protein